MHRTALRIFGSIALGVALTDCRTPAPAAALAISSADSIVLERSVCFGFCPAYRLTLHANGVVHFVATPRGDTVQRADTISPRSVQWLVGQAHRAGFFTLPTNIVSDTSLCAARATDHPTATVTIFRGDSTHSVIDYQGCYTDYSLGVAAPLRPLRRLESAIDSVAGSKRWRDLAQTR